MDRLLIPEVAIDTGQPKVGSCMGNTDLQGQEADVESECGGANTPVENGVAESTSEMVLRDQRVSLGSASEQSSCTTRVLLIEDNPELRLRIRSLFASPAFESAELEESRSLSQGLARIAQGGVDAVLVEIAPPATGGPTSCDEIRRISPHLAIVGLVGSGAYRDDEPKAPVDIEDSIENDDLDERFLAKTVQCAIDRARFAHERSELEEALAQVRTELQDLAYVVSHDLREPLRMVGSYVQLLARHCAGQLDEEAIRFIHHASTGAAQLKSMIDALLRYSRLSRAADEFGPVALGTVFEEAVTSLSRRVEDVNARIDSDELPTVLGNSAQLYVLLRNLIDNALLFRGESAPLMHLSAAHDGERCTFSFSDNGIGFDPEQADRIFRPFQRLHARNEFPGNGMGLALVRRIVARHRGRVWAESEPGVGSVIHFSLPLSECLEEVT